MWTEAQHATHKVRASYLPETKEMLKQAYAHTTDSNRYGTDLGNHLKEFLWAKAEIS